MTHPQSIYHMLTDMRDAISEIYTEGTGLYRLTELRLQLKAIIREIPSTKVEIFKFALSRMPLVYFDPVSEEDMSDMFPILWNACLARPADTVYGIINLFTYLTVKNNTEIIQLPTDRLEEILVLIENYPIRWDIDPRPGDILRCHLFGDSMQVFSIREFGTKEMIDHIHEFSNFKKR